MKERHTRSPVAPRAPTAPGSPRGPRFPSSPAGPGGPWTPGGPWQRTQRMITIGSERHHQCDHHINQDTNITNTVKLNVCAGNEQQQWNPSTCSSCMSPWSILGHFDFTLSCLQFLIMRRRQMPWILKSLVLRCCDGHLVHFDLNVGVNARGLLTLSPLAPVSPLTPGAPASPCSGKVKEH